MRNRMAIVVVVAAILLSLAPLDEVRAAFLPGDFITYSQTSWGETILPGGPTLVVHFDTVYPSGLLEVGIPGATGHSIIFSSSTALLDYLPSTGVAGQLNADLVDPLSSASGVFGGEVTALHLNINFADAGPTLGALGIPFGDLVIHSYSPIPQVNGLSLRQLLEQADTLLGGGAVGYGVLDAANLVFEVNNAFNNGELTTFAQENLRLPTQVPEPGTLVLMGIGVGGFAVARFKTRLWPRGRH